MIPQYGLAALVSLFLALLAGRLIIPVLTRLRFGQVVRSDGPRTHLDKQGTPTMGGLIFLVPASLVIPVFAIADRVDFTKVLLLGVLVLGFAAIGLADDALKVVFKRPLGLKARHKLLGQLLVAVVGGLILIYSTHSTALIIPFLNIELEIGLFYWPFFALLSVGFGNAVNMADGIDGLAGSTVAIACLAFCGIGVMGDLPFVVMAAAVLTAALLGFLFYNRYPARVFMGDVGSLALGGALAALAVLSKSELLLLIVGGVFVFEAFTVTLQVIYFRTTGGKRFFRMAPFHHHLELLGWREQKVLTAFVLGSTICALVGLWGYRLYAPLMR